MCLCKNLPQAKSPSLTFIKRSLHRTGPGFPHRTSDNAMLSVQVPYTAQCGLRMLPKHSDQENSKGLKGRVVMRKPRTRAHSQAHTDARTHVHTHMSPGQVFDSSSVTKSIVTIRMQHLLPKSVCSSSIVWVTFSVAGKAPSRDLCLSNSLKNEEFLVTDHGDFCTASM